jgi:uncharacterized protein
MRCPVDGTTLALAERSGVEIDYCPECRGLWLDRGELDRIIDRVAGGPRTETRYSRDDGDHHHDHHHQDRDRDQDHQDRDRRDRDHDDDERGWGQRTGRRRGGPLSALGDLLGGGD